MPQHFLDPLVERVYSLMLAEPGVSLSTLAQQADMSEPQIRDALDLLADMDLVSPDGATGDLRPVSPRLGLAKYINDAEAELERRQSELSQARSALARLAAEQDAAQNRESLVRIVGLESVRMRLAEMAATASRECLTFFPGVAQTPDAHNASVPLNEAALSRGVAIRSVYQGSFRNDPNTLAFAMHLAQMGGETRTVPVVPIQMVLVDREVALLPIDPEDRAAGALEIRTPGIVAALGALFDKVWMHAERLDQFQRRSEGDEPTRQELELLKLLGEGHTDESAARRLDLSVRTVRRMIAELMTRLDAGSRFEAGAQAARRGWLD